MNHSSFKIYILRKITNSYYSVSDASEEVKYSTVRCLTVLMLSIPHEFRLKLLNTQVPMLAQAVFVSVHIAKLERLRVLRYVIRPYAEMVLKQRVFLHHIIIKFSMLSEVSQNNMINKKLLKARMQSDIVCSVSN